MLVRKIFLRLNDQNIFWNLHLDIIIQIIVAHNFHVFFLVSEQCQIGFIGENCITKTKIIMFNDGDAL